MVAFFKLVVAILVQACIVLSQTSKVTTKYCDTKTSICYAEYKIDAGVYFRIALPTNASTSDAILQISAPVKIKWVGMGWGGRMTGDPLTVVYPSGTTNGVTVSSRFATSYTMPSAYSSASYTSLKGAATNSTYWTASVRCLGCTRWTYSGNSFNVDSASSIRLAYAYSTVAVDNPKSNTTTFKMHEEYNYFNIDLTSYGKAPQATYDGWVKTNS